jgi:DNA-binding GntR family transcriptional regulator
VENDLASSLGVGRITLRGALQRLHQEGLITLQPHRGAKVTDITFEEAMQIMEVRMGLEGWAAALAAQRMTPPLLAEMEQIVAGMDQLLQENKLLEYSEGNAAFHRKIIEAASNERLKQNIDSLQTALVRYRFRTILVPGRSQHSFGEHSAILSALREGSTKAAEDAMRKHIEGVARTMSEARRLMEL